MRISELIARLENLKKHTGDITLKEVKISYPYSTSHSRMYSPTRVTKSGDRAYMNFKEYTAYLEGEGLKGKDIPDEI